MSLPAEVMRMIFEQLVLDSVRQAMRVRLVCKYFATELIEVLISSRVLEAPKWLRCEIPQSLMARMLFAISRRGARQQPPLIKFVDAFMLKHRDWLSRKPCYGRLWLFSHLQETTSSLERFSWVGYKTEPPANEMSVIGINISTQCPSRLGYMPGLPHLTPIALLSCNLNSLASRLVNGADASSITQRLIVFAVKHGKEDFMLSLVRRKSTKKFAKSFVRYAVLVAARHGDVHMFEALFGVYESILWGDLEDYNYFEIARAAASGDRVGPIHYLMSKLHSGWFTGIATQMLRAATLYTAPKTLLFAMKNGANPSFFSGEHMMAFARKGHTKVISLRLRSMNEQNPDHIKACMRSSQEALVYGWLETADVLLTWLEDAGRTTLPQNKELLHEVVRSGQVDSMALLLQHKSEQLNHYWQVYAQAIELSKALGFTSIERLLKEYHAEPDVGCGQPKMKKKRKQAKNK